MKKLLPFIAALLLLGQVRAQVTDQGNFLLGSTIGFATSRSSITQGTPSGEEKGEGPLANQVHFAPSIGYFLLDNTVLGIRMDYTLSRQEEEGVEKVKDSDLLFGPFARYYLPVGNDMAFLIEAGFGFGNSSDLMGLNGDRQTITTNMFAFGVGPGFTIISSKAIGLEAIFKYNYARSHFNTEIGGVSRETITKTDAFDISLGLHLYFAGFNRVPLTR